MSAWAWSLIGLGVVIVFVGLHSTVYLPFAFRIRRYEPKVKDLPQAFEGLKIVFLSDLHMGRTYPAPMIRRVFRAAMAQQPDLILLGGDYTWGMHGRMEPFFKLLPMLHAPLGVFAVVGNHDLLLLNDMYRLLPISHVRFLRNEGVVLERGGHRLLLYGLDYLIWDHPRSEELLEWKKREDAPLLMVCHHPDILEDMLDNAPAVWDMAFCGHTHDGQIVLLKNSKPFAHYRNVDAGLRIIAGGQVIISAGIGTSGLPVRYRCRPDFCVATLMGQDQ